MGGEKRITIRPSIVTSCLLQPLPTATRDDSAVLHGLTADKLL
jgi:hypothetical protein